MFCIGFDGYHMPPEVAELIDRGVGSVILFKRNFSSPQQALELTASLKERAGTRPLLINVDQEGGRVMRLTAAAGATPIPSMRILGRANDLDLTRQIGQILAREMRAINIDQVNAPVLDVDTNPANPVIADRSFGPSPELVSRHGVALLQGIQGESVAACGKHFPGHGDTAQDTHFSLPHLPHDLDRMERIELPPFRAAIHAGVAAIMSAHLIYDRLEPAGLPATMSAPIMQGILRDHLGFTGVTYTDDLEMRAIHDNFGIGQVVRSVANASVDVLCVCHTPALQSQAIDELVQAVERGQVKRELIEAANRRLDTLASRYYRPPVRGKVSPIIGCDAHQRIVDRIHELAGSPATTSPDPTAVMDHLVKQKSR
jgi:beta-N-acetylhexosaminidase